MDFVLLVLLFTSISLSLEEKESIKLGMYPYLPSLDRFESLISERWNSIHPDIPVTIESFNCYHEEKPPEDMDAFVIDNILLQAYVKNELISPITYSEVENISDFFSFAIGSVSNRDSENSGNDLFCIPIFGCSFILFYRSDDDEIDRKVSTIDDLYDIIGDNLNFTSPQNGRGLLFEMTSKNDIVSTYMMSEEYRNGKSSKFPSIPWSLGPGDYSLTNVLQKFVRMVGLKIAKSKKIDMVAEFQNGNGRALIGFTETMAEFDPNYLDVYGVKMKIIPLHTNDEIKNKRTESLFDLFFVDSLCLNPNVMKSKRSVVLELMNLIVSEDLMFEILSKGGNGGQPQFVIPSRNSTLSKLGKSNQNYEMIWNLITKSQKQKKYFLVGDEIVQWLQSSSSDRFMSQVFNITTPLW